MGFRQLSITFLHANIIKTIILECKKTMCGACIKELKSATMSLRYFTKARLTKPYMELAHLYSEE